MRPIEFELPLEFKNTALLNEDVKIIQQPNSTKIDFEIIQTIGSGSFGKVCLSRLNGDLCAIKVVKKETLLQIDRNFESVRNETIILTELAEATSPCPYLVKLIHPQFEDVDNFYTPLEYCPGGELF